MNALPSGPIGPFHPILKSDLCLPGSQLGPWRPDFDTRCYQGNQNADSYCHANCSHICTITIQVCATLPGLKSDKKIKGDLIKGVFFHI